jgi:hypothetical protein
LVTAATAILEQIKLQQESQISLSDLPVFPKRNLSKAAQDIFDRMGFGYILRVRPKGKMCLVYPITRAGQKPPLRVDPKAAYELIDSGLLRHMEVDTRNNFFGLTELGIYSKGNFYCCLQ